MRNEEVEEKNKEIKTKLCSLVSRKWLERFSSNLVCRTSLANLVLIGLGITELHRCEIAFSFFLLIYPRCGAPATLDARHTTVCLDDDVW